MNRRKKVVPEEDLTKLKIILPENRFLPVETNVNAWAHAKLLSLQRIWMPPSLVARLQVKCTQNSETGKIDLCLESRT